nr:hypothetical protein [Tanacetum cinerariifolium]
MAPLPDAYQRHPWLRYEVERYTSSIVHSYEQRLKTIWSRPVNQVYVLDFAGLTLQMRQDLAVRMKMVYSREGQQEMAEDGFGAYWARSDRLIHDKGDLKDYWIKISSDRDFLGPAPSYVFIRDPVRRLCYRMIAYSISGMGQAHEKVTGVDIFYLCSMDHGTINVPYLLAQYLFRHAERKKSRARLSRGHFIWRLAMHSGLAATAGSLEADEAGKAAEEVALEIPAPAPTLAPPPPPPAYQRRITS